MGVYIRRLQVLHDRDLAEEAVILLPLVHTGTTKYCVERSAVQSFKHAICLADDRRCSGRVVHQCKLPKVALVCESEHADGVSAVLWRDVNFNGPAAQDIVIVSRITLLHHSVPCG
eukprot:1421280-Rhodomonas_salina.3